MGGTRGVEPPAVVPRDGLDGAPIPSMDKQGTTVMEESSSGVNEEAGEVGKHIPKEQLKEEPGRGLSMDRRVTVKAGQAAGLEEEEVGQAVIILAKQLRLKGSRLAKELG